MAKLPAGVLSNPKGVIGDIKVRVRKDGSLLILPRYPRDKRSEAQLEIRRRFALVARWSSMCYLKTLKPFWWTPWRGYNAIARSIERSLPDWFEFSGIPRFYCGGEWELKKTGLAIRYTAATQISSVEFSQTFPPDVQAGDKFYACVMEQGESLRVCVEPTVWPSNSLQIGWGSNWPSTRMIGITHFRVRDVGGLYDVLSPPQFTWISAFYEKTVPIQPPEEGG